MATGEIDGDRDSVEVGAAEAGPADTEPVDAGPSDDGIVDAELIDPKPVDTAPGDVEVDAPSAAPVDPLAAVTAERDSLRELAQRVQAEFENYRRRVATTHADEVDRATGKLVEGLLPVLDACEAAFAHGVEGIEPIWSALIGALQKLGLEALDLHGAEFDPTLADAVMHEPADEHVETPMVSEVLRTGYRWKGRVLRPAMVRVKG